MKQAGDPLNGKEPTSDSLYTDYEIIKALSEAKSQTRGTSLITMLIPPKTNYGLVTSKITSELSTSENIKNKIVRSSVQSSLRSGLQQIRSCSGNNAPENGLILCAGEIETRV